ncbi:flagellar assembly protein FliH [Paenibacillaceae bacterium]|nr:flagellar assembly protein FliH [Paenibacillaceae bacterium]
MSRLFKSSHVVTLEQLKKLEWDNRHAKQQAAMESNRAEESWAAQPVPSEETITLRDQIINDAEAFAAERIRQAGEEAERLLSEARGQIEMWWADRRAEDEELVKNARQTGYHEGYELGFTTAEAENNVQWERQLSEARTLLEQAYQTREQIIQEAEPFLVELSCAIADKIIGKQLTVSPELAIELIGRSLARRREQGTITLCVAPAQLAFVQAAREELNLAIDSQAELQILPDATIKDHGCVIRSAYGSIDARIDTQLEEVKRELLQLALHNEEWGQDDDAATS